MFKNRWKPYGRVLDIDSRDAGAPESSESSDILDIFKMDFEGDEPETPAQSGTAESEPASSSEPETPAETPSDPSDSSETQTQAETPVEQIPDNSKPKSPNAEELLAQALEVNRKLAEQLEHQKEAPKQPSQPEEDEDTKVFSPRNFSDYTFNINPKLYEGLFSADATQEERIQCLQAYASGIATTVHNNILATLGKWTKENFESVPGVVQLMIGKAAEASQTSNQLREEFYKKNPDLQKPEIFPLLKATIQTVQKETKANAWTPQFADTVAQRVRAILSGYAQATKPKAAAPIITPVAAKPAPVVKETDPNGMEAIFATLYSDF